MSDGVPAPVASVVVPAFRAADTIAACLRGLQGQDLAEPFEVIVVASGGDATADIVRRAFPRVALLESGGRLTPGACRNLGIARARADVIAFLAADCVPEPDWLRRRVDAHRGGHELVGGYLDVATPSTIAGWSQYFSKFWGVLALDGRVHTGRGPLFHLSYTRGVLERGGAFLDAVAGEDTAYNHALVASGARVHFDAAIRARHVNARRFTDVVAAQREQGAATGELCRDGAVAPYYAASVRGGVLGPLVTTIRAGLTVTRFRPRLVPRFVVCAPLVVVAIAARRRAFRRAYRDRGVADPAAPPRAHERPPVGRARPLVSVVVAAFDEERLIAGCLDSLLSQSYEPLEIIVADDGSRDRTVEIATSRAVPVLCLPHRGPATARNAGARAARGEAVVFVDADLVLDTDCVARLVEPILARRETGTFTRNIGVANAADPWSACWSLRRGVAPGSYMPDGVPDRWENFRAIDREAFLSVDGYDDVGYGEDMTLARKLQQQAAVVPARMWHHNPDSLREVWQNAVWFGRGERVHELPRPWLRYAPWSSIRRSVRIARAHRRPRYVVFATVYDVGVLTGLAASRIRRGRHWK